MIGALLDGGLNDLLHVFGTVEGVDVEAVAELAGHFGEVGVDAGYVDRDLRIVYRSGVEERRHEGVLVELALEL